MGNQWEIIYYTSLTGANPVRDFISCLNENTQAKVARTLDLLSKYNIFVREPHTKKLSGTPLWELRILGKDNIRLFYVTVLHKSFLLLHGFVKRENKTPRREINVALARLVDWQNREG